MKQISREGIQRMITVPQASGGGGGGSFDPMAMGLASEAWVEENYISKAFFNRLFTIHSASSVIDPNDPDEEQTIDSIEALVGLWTEQYLSALGQGSGGGGGGGITLNDPLDAINSAGLSDPVTAGSALVWYGGAWTYSPSARLQVAGLNSSAAVSVTGSVTATSFVRNGGTSSMFLKADGSVDTTVYAAQDWVNQNFITIAFFETLFNAVDANGNKVNANTTTGIDSIKAMFGFWTNQYLSALGQGTGGGGGGVTLNQPLSSINSAGLGAPSVSGSTLVWNGTTWTYSSSIGDTKNTAGSSQQPSGVQLYLIGASAQATWGVTYSNSGCYIGTDGYLYSGGAKVLTSSAGFVTGISVNNGNPISPVNGVVALTDIITAAGGTMTGSLSISGSGSHLSVGGNIGAQGTITSQDYITATGYKVPSGTSAGFLKADGSVDTTSYSTTDTMNTAGATAQPNSVIYLVGAGSYNSTYAVTYTNSGCYISADGYLYSGGVRVLTSGNVVQTITINNGTPISPTNGNVNISIPTASDYLKRDGWHNESSSDNVNSLVSGIGFYYTTHNAPTNGTVVSFCGTTDTYQFQIQCQYNGSNIYFRPKNSDNNTWGDWNRLAKASEIPSISNLVHTITINSGTPISPTNGNINIGVPTKTSDLTNDSGFITSDTKNTTGATNLASTKLFLIGATAQNTDPVTYSNSTCFIDTYNFLNATGITTGRISCDYIYRQDEYYVGSRYQGSVGHQYQGLYLIAYSKPIVMNQMTYVGIGTETPSYKLHVAGDIYTTSKFIVANGTSSQFLKADGTLDSTAYATTDTLNTAGATAQPNSAIYLVGAGSYNSTYAVTYTNSGCYISADGYLYSGGSRVLTSSAGLVTGISIGGGTPYEPTNGIVGLPAYPVNTDTTNTAGATNLTATKLFLIGATAQSDGLRTYSNSTCFIDTYNFLNATGITTGRINCQYTIDTNDFYVGRSQNAYGVGYTGLTLYAYRGNIYFGGMTYVGINTTSPAYKLDVNGNLGCHDLIVTTASGSTGSASIAADLTVGEHVYTPKIGNGMTNMRFETNGNVGIGVQNTSGYLLQVNGAVAGTSWTNLSDMRQKNYVDDENIELWQVANAPVFKFTWKNPQFGAELHVGSSAQYWQTIVPEAVTTDGLGNLGLQYDVVALLAAITTAKKVQEHERRIEELERENKVLWNMIATLKAA